MLTNMYTAVLVKNNNWPSSVHCKVLIVGWEAEAVTLEVVYTAISPIAHNKKDRGQLLAIRLLCYKYE